MNSGKISSSQIRVTLKGYDYSLLDRSVQEIVQTVKRTGGRVVGPVPLPRKVAKFIVNRSTFVDKKAREQFELRVSKRMLGILEPTQQTVDELGKLELASGVSVEISLL